MSQTKVKQFTDQIKEQERNIKKGKAIEFDELAQPSQKKREKERQGKKPMREYVDMSMDDDEKTFQLEQLVVALILKLKQLYFNRKTKQPKGKMLRNNEAVKKRYIIGMHEVMQKLKVDEIKMIVLATDLEKVDLERGIDEVINNIASICRAKGVPLVFAFSRYRLGCLAKQ